MKKLLFCILLFVLPSIINAQSLGARYFWCDTLNLTTSVTDTTWATEWEYATIWTDTVDCYVRIGAPDYGDWTSRNYLYLPNGLTLSIGPTPQLKRLAAYLPNGTGVLYIAGYKKTRQY